MPRMKGSRLLYLIKPILTTVISTILLSAAIQMASAATKPAPDFTLKTLEGEELNLGNLKGKVVLLNFWASWCSPCREEMPLLDKLHQRYKKEGLVLLGVNIEPNSIAVRQAITRLAIQFPVLLDQQQQVTELYGITAMPTTVVIDREGNTRFLHRGYKPGHEKKYEIQIQSLLKE
jgi:thiol-disulfide isomerase/thioredoxin